MYNEYFCENNNNITQDNSDQNNISDDSVSSGNSDYRLKQIKGKTIVLVESDNPWYLNKDETIQLPYKKNIRLTNKQYRNDADYGSYENSEYFNGKIKKKNNIYNNQEQTQSQNHIILLLVLFLVLLFIYKKYTKGNIE
jgi:hypothetical protein